MIKKILIGIILLGIIAIIGFFIFMANFDIFGESIETELKAECDNKGLRKIILTKVAGNATMNPGMTIYATDCKNDKEKEPEPIFVTDLSYLKNSDVNFEWKNSDTIIIKYNKKLRIFKQETESKTVDPKIIFEYIAE
ncbi:hypothetical protein UMM65_00810 [Aureibaculum sp. 2210JD6-5]|uniref:hypothetical protein n=1 Tax=Aureibaculum sp. 2210JD6-5 TaxID=3103957 RepID=UPI002AAD1FDB|nr:hypothetical protein [Aureibaculum sp. 2210JD6-5]MDY7393770.1 hypothetical protein [Aureibaculum sp. 2210JD6-5]